MVTFSPIRAAVVLLTIGVLLTALSARVAYLQTYGREQTIRRAERQQHQNETLFARRGSIFDASGLLLAGTVQMMSVYVDPKFMQEQYDGVDGRTLNDMDRDLGKLGELIDRDPFELAQLLSDRYTDRFVRLAENLDEPTCDAIRELRMPGLGLMPMNQRYYPMGSIASHVLGGVGGEGTGLEGLELKFERQLAGKNGYKRTLKDARRRPIAVAADDYLPPQNGQHLILTIDSNIQMIAEQELAAACRQFAAKRGEAIVIDPQTGDVLAMANWPNFNPQNLEDSTPELRRNRCLTDPYEPGSTLKPFIVGPALAWDVTRVGEVFPINGPHYKSSLRSKLVVDVHGYERLNTWDILVKSSNIGMTMIAERMGKGRIHDALAGFRFGQPTGVELPGEDPGLLRPARRWGTSDIVSTVQGYSVMVTPIQLARAMCAYANGGRLVQPRILKGVLEADGSVHSRSDDSGVKLWPQVLDPVTSVQMRRVLADVPVRGTATKARSKTWNLFGKTGTAHIAQGGNYNSTSYTSSFVGGAPVESPRLVVAFVIHEADKSKAGGNAYGGAIAAPAAGKALERSLAYLQTPASPDLTLPPPHIASGLYAYDEKVYRRRDGMVSTARE